MRRNVGSVGNIDGKGRRRSVVTPSSSVRVKRDRIYITGLQQSELKVGHKVEFTAKQYTASYSGCYVVKNSLGGPAYLTAIPKVLIGDINAANAYATATPGHTLYVKASGEAYRIDGLGLTVVDGTATLGAAVLDGDLSGIPQLVGQWVFPATLDTVTGSGNEIIEYTQADWSGAVCELIEDPSNIYYTGTSTNIGPIGGFVRSADASGVTIDTDTSYIVGEIRITPSDSISVWYPSSIRKSELTTESVSTSKLEVTGDNNWPGGAPRSLKRRLLLTGPSGGSGDVVAGEALYVLPDGRATKKLVYQQSLVTDVGTTIGVSGSASSRKAYPLPDGSVLIYYPVLSGALYDVRCKVVTADGQFYGNEFTISSDGVNTFKVANPSPSVPGDFNILSYNADTGESWLLFVYQTEGQSGQGGTVYMRTLLVRGLNVIDDGVFTSKLRQVAVMNGLGGSSYTYTSLDYGSTSNGPQLLKTLVTGRSLAKSRSISVVQLIMMVDAATIYGGKSVARTRILPVKIDTTPSGGSSFNIATDVTFGTEHHIAGVEPPEYNSFVFPEVLYDEPNLPDQLMTVSVLLTEVLSRFHTLFVLGVDTSSMALYKKPRLWDDPTNLDVGGRPRCLERSVCISTGKGRGILLSNIDGNNAAGKDTSTLAVVEFSSGLELKQDWNELLYPENGGMSTDYISFDNRGYSAEIDVSMYRLGKRVGTAISVTKLPVGYALLMSRLNFSNLSSSLVLLDDRLRPSLIESITGATHLSVGANRETDSVYTYGFILSPSFTDTIEKLKVHSSPVGSGVADENIQVGAQGVCVISGEGGKNVPLDSTTLSSSAVVEVDRENTGAYIVGDGRKAAASSGLVSYQSSILAATSRGSSFLAYTSDAVYKAEKCRPYIPSEIIIEGTSGRTHWKDSLSGSDIGLKWVGLNGNYTTSVPHAVQFLQVKHGGGRVLLDNRVTGALVGAVNLYDRGVVSTADWTGISLERLGYGGSLYSFQDDTYSGGHPGFNLYPPGGRMARMPVKIVGLSVELGNSVIDSTLVPFRQSLEPWDGTRMEGCIVTVSATSPGIFAQTPSNFTFELVNTVVRRVTVGSGRLATSGTVGFNLLGGSKLDPLLFSGSVSVYISQRGNTYKYVADDFLDMVGGGNVYIKDVTPNGRRLNIGRVQSTVTSYNVQEGVDLVLVEDRTTNLTIFLPTIRKATSSTLNNLTVNRSGKEIVIKLLNTGTSVITVKSVDVTTVLIDNQATYTMTGSYSTVRFVASDQQERWYVIT